MKSAWEAVVANDYSCKKQIKPVNSDKNMYKEFDSFNF
jgi:hypothetical protein